MGGMIFLSAFLPASANDRTTPISELDGVAYAVDGAESSHGANRLMWRPDAAGPQGPMQVSEKAAIDVGGGNRFDVVQNRAIGRAYLALLYGRYRNWPDAISAYNWGMGHLDSWIKAGRQPETLVKGVSSYTRRVLQDSGVCDGAGRVAAVCEPHGSSAPRASQSWHRSLAKAEMLAMQFAAAQNR